MRNTRFIKIFLLFFPIFLVSLHLKYAKAQKTDVVLKEEFYINQDNLTEVEITGSVAKQDLIKPGMSIKVSLTDEVGNNVSRHGLIDAQGEFRVSLDASLLFDGEIKLNAVVFVEGALFGEGGIKREEKIYDNLSILKDTHSPQRLSLNSLTTPAWESVQKISGEKPKNTSVWLNGRQIVVLNNDSFWSYPLTLKEGDNHLQLAVRDKSGNESDFIEADIVYDPTLISSANLDLKERADGSGIVDININFNQVPKGVPQIVINTQYGEDTPPTDLSGTGMFWAFEYQGSSVEGLGQVTVLIKDPDSGELNIISFENSTFQVNVFKDKPKKSDWQLPAPPDPATQYPRPVIIPTSKVEELDNALVEIRSVKILDPFANYKNGAAVHLEVEYEDKSYNLFKSLLKQDFDLDDRYTYFEKDFEERKSVWHPIRADFSKLDSRSVDREIRIGESVKVGNNRYKRTISYKIDLDNITQDGEIPIKIKLENILGKNDLKTVNVKLRNGAPVSIDKDILRGFEDPLLSEIEEVLLIGTLKEATDEGYIALLVYSDPIVKTVKTDKFGRWTYTLKRPIDSGEHLIYGAEIDKNGNMGEVVQLASFIVPALAAEEEATQAVNIEELETVIEKVKLPEVPKERSRSRLGEFTIFIVLSICAVLALFLGFGQTIIKRLKSK